MHLLMNIWAISTFWLLWIILWWALVYKICFVSIFNSFRYLPRIIGSYSNSSDQRSDLGSSSWPDLPANGVGQAVLSLHPGAMQIRLPGIYQHNGTLCSHWASTLWQFLCCVVFWHDLCEIDLIIILLCRLGNWGLGVFYITLQGHTGCKF